MKPALTRAACLLCAAFASLTAPAASAASQTILRAAEQQSAPVNPANFTGAARSDGTFHQQAPAEFTAAGSPLNPDPGRTGTSIRWVRH